MSSGLPNPLARLPRNPLAVAAAAGLVGVASAAASLGESARVRLDERVDKNWRGAYDILVRPAGARLDLESTNGLVEPNFASFAGHGGIGFDRLDAIRAVPGVEVAAPIATVGEVGYAQQSPTVHFAADAYPDEITLYEYRLEFVTSDGLEELVVQTETGRVLIGPGRRLATELNGSDAPGGGRDRHLLPLPQQRSPIMAVDPAHERDLLNADPEFLRGLQEVGASDRQAEAFDASRIPFDIERDLYEFYSTDGPGDRPVVPVAVTSLSSPLQLRLIVSQVGEPLEDWPSGATAAITLAEASEQAGAELVRVSEETLDLRESLLPFQTPPIVIPWFGSGTPAEGGPVISGGRVPQTTTTLLERPTYHTSEEGSHFVLEPRDPVLLADERASALHPAQPQQTYRGSTAVAIDAAAGFGQAGPQDAPYLLAPIGTYDPSTLEIATGGVAYVPLGAYDPSETRHVAAGASVAMSSTLNARGLVAIPPLAITDMEGARVLRGDEPIDAVRVRVAGISVYDRVAVGRVEAVASEIAELGLDVDIVAGSSPQEIELFVPEYRFDRLVTSREFASADLDPTDLGLVRQSWSTLGAAEVVERGLGAASTALLVLSLLAAGVLAISLQTMRSAMRARDAAILGALGWTRWRIVRWMSSESWLAAAAVVALSLVAWALWRGTVWSLATAMGIALLLVLSDGAAVLGAIRRSTTSQLQAGDVRVGGAVPMLVAVVGQVSFAARTLMARPVRTVALMLALIVSAAATAVGIAVVGGIVDRVGPTRLADVVSSELALGQWAIVSLCALGGLLLAVVVTRFDLRDRADERLALTASGWRPNDIRALRRLERSMVAVPAAAAAGAVTWLAATPVAVVDSLGPTVIAAAIALSYLAWGGLVAIRSGPRP